MYYFRLYKLLFLCIKKFNNSCTVFLAIRSPLVITHYPPILYVHFNTFCYRKRGISNLIEEFSYTFSCSCRMAWWWLTIMAETSRHVDYKAKCDCEYDYIYLACRNTGRKTCPSRILSTTQRLHFFWARDSRLIGRQITPWPTQCPSQEVHNIKK